MKDIKDLLGRTIRVGDLVVNSVIKYKSSAMRLGVVAKIDDTRRYGETIFVRRTTSSSWVRPGKVAVIRWDFLAKDHTDYAKLIEILGKIE